jgi:UDP-glucose 4-epimerase
MLLERGEQVIVFGRSRAKMEGLIQNKTHVDNLIMISGDVTDTDSVNECISVNRPDIVIHTAAITGIKTCLDNPKESFNVNVYGTYNVAKACAKMGSRLIFTSSREVYGETVGDYTPENAPTLPNNLYGITKLLGEKIITCAKEKNNLNYTILRFTNVYGFGGDKYGVQVLIRKTLAGNALQILGGEQIMNFVHVEDVASSVLTCLYSDSSIGKTFNVGSDDTVSVNYLVRKIIQLIGQGNTIEQKAGRETETLRFKPDLTEISGTLGWKPQIRLDEGLLRTIEAYKKVEDAKLLNMNYPLLRQAP